MPPFSPGHFTGQELGKSPTVTNIYPSPLVYQALEGAKTGCQSSALPAPTIHAPLFPSSKPGLPQSYSQGTVALPSQPKPTPQLVCEPLQMLSCPSQMGGGSTGLAILRPLLLVAPHNYHPLASYLYGLHDYPTHAVPHCLVLPLHQANRGECWSLLSSAHFRRWYI